MEPMSRRLRDAAVPFQRPPSTASTSASMSWHRQNLITFPRSPAGVRTFDFGPFFGKGIDQIASALLRQIQRYLEGKDRRLQIPSIVTICRLGITSFLRFLENEASLRGESLDLSDIDSALIDRYVKHLNAHAKSQSAKRRTFSTVKTVLLSLSSRGLVRSEGLLPPNPFPSDTYETRNALDPYSPQEVQAIAQALRDAINPIYSPDVELTSELLSYCVFILALRTGQNLTPLMELSADCLRPHFKDGHKLLTLEKRRSSKRVHVAVPASREDVIGVMPATVRLIERLRELTEPLRDEAPARLRDRLLIYRSRAHPIGQIVELAASVLTLAARRLERKYEILDENGCRVRINVTRMRKTFVNRIYEVTRGDLHATAIAAGHTISVTDDHYLAPPASAEAKWRFMGEVLSSELSSGDAEKHLTPVGHCRDNRGGEYAPRDGRTCTDFLNCFRCRDYVVTADDLHKIFSFYWRVAAERKTTEARTWARRFAVIIRTIDRDIAERGVELGVFSQRAVDDARTRGKTEPHPYWKLCSDLENDDEKVDFGTISQAP